MKHTKRIFAIVMTLMLSMTMLFAMSITSFAAKNDKITVNGAKTGETYEIYKMFDLTVDDEENPTAYTYKVNENWAAFFTGTGAGAQYVTISDTGVVTAISDPAALAKAAAEWTGKPAATQTKEASGTTVEFTGLDDGYWLITSTLGTKAMAETTPDASAVTVNEKNPDDTIDKQVKEDSTGTFGESNDAQVGDTVEFKSKVKIVKGTRNVVVHDKMTTGLTYTTGSVAITGLTKGTEYSVNESPTDGDTFDITFTQSWIDKLDFGTDGYKEYEITYTAVLNENAVVKDENGVAIVDQNNKTHVSYGDGTNSEEDSTTTTNHKFALFKHKKGATDNLAGAIFSLKKAGTVVNLIKLDDNNYRVAKSGESGAVTQFTTVANGDIFIWGVDSDSDYALTEVKPPEGYNPLPNDVPVTVGSDNATRIDVENNAGNELPATGGIGTVIFYTLGSLLVIGCGIVLISRKRTNN